MFGLRPMRECSSFLDFHPRRHQDILLACNFELTLTFLIQHDNSDRCGLSGVHHQMIDRFFGNEDIFFILGS